MSVYDLLISKMCQERLTEVSCAMEPITAAYELPIFSTQLHFEEALSICLAETRDPVTALVQYFSFVPLTIQAGLLIG